MGSNWINALDNCAAGGVLDFDAAAYLLDQPERFVGHPKFEDIPAIQQPLLLPPNTKIKGELKEDEFSSQNSKDLVQNPSWKKWLTGGLIVTAIAGITVGILTKTGKIKMPDMSSLGTSLKNAGTTVLDFIKKPFTWIAGKLKKTP